jgi:hypothetical protein
MLIGLAIGCRHPAPDLGRPSLPPVCRARALQTEGYCNGELHPDLLDCMVCIGAHGCIDPDHEVYCVGRGGCDDPRCTSGNKRRDDQLLIH